MNPTPTHTHCPSLDDLHRLLMRALPEDDAARLHGHLHRCSKCRELWQSLQGATIAAPTPPLLHPTGDTNPGKPAPPAPPSPINWSSEVSMLGAGGERAPAAPSSMPTRVERAYAFLDAARERGELGWLAHYRITAVLGEGGMGFVFDAFDTRLHRRVALKVLKPELAANLNFRERFLQEARLAAALPDDYIITIYEVGLANDVPYLAMKFLHGESLEQRLQRDGRLPTHEVLHIGREVALGLSAAHERGLIHRDIKPANLWLETPPPDQSGGSGARLSCEFVYRVKVLDFGLARPMNDPRKLTATGLIVGTPSYLAPEQARGQPLDHRCDLFSLGCVLYRMVTGNLPFDGPDTLAQLTALAIAEPPAIENLAPDVPVELRNLIHQLLARDPSKRPATARAVAEALRTLEKSGILPSEFASLPTTVPILRGAKRGPRSPSRRHWLLAGALLALSILGGFLLWWKLRPGAEANIVPALSQEPIRVGVLFSLRGPMANGGGAAHDAAQLAIDELNQQGGVLGRPVEGVVGDGESDYRKFAALAEKLITKDHVCALFGTRASSARKAVRPIVEKYDNLLFYPMQFEGLEDSPNIIYLGVAPNQQMLPALDYLMSEERGKRRIFLIGSDYVFPRTANAILRDHIRTKYPDAQIVGEEYIPFGGTEVQEAIRAIQKAKPDLILNTINGDTNSAFFRELHQARLRPDTTPVLSFSVGENDLASLGESAVGHYAAWSYFQSLTRPESREFVRKFRARFGSRRVVSDPMETVYFGVHLWAQGAQAAGSTEPRAVVEALKGRSFTAPEGDVRIDRKTRYTWRPMRVSRVNEDGRFEIRYSTEWALQPEPFPSTRPRAAWEDFLHKMYKDWGDSWQAPSR
ncbi:MAG TPA: transporter substrate-binding protein [Gemmataceae bacterium]|jgi:urea transport system substrate-binding protein